MKQTLVTYSTHKGVALIELNNPPVNGYSFDMFKQIDEAVIEARFDKDVHIIVIKGAGEKFFCAGADIEMLKGADPHFKYNFCLHANETLLRLEHTPKLVIAAINGHCVGGGLEIAMAADIRIAREGAGKMGLPEVALGVLAGTGGTQRLGRILGKSKAIELMISGEVFDEKTALELGIINAIYSHDTFMEDIMAYAEQFCPPNKPSMAVGHIKRSVQSGVELPLESGLALERELQQRLFTSNDAKEGISSFLEKKKPHFSGH
ncbi:MAG: enoyl-CoA hydratase/isomerase family protein [Methylocystaceae bacterium]|nr:enoyl-CoA hydratase/isomerase family protein [Methylocystaceae bacterium]